MYMHTKTSPTATRRMWRQTATRLHFLLRPLLEGFSRMDSMRALIPPRVAWRRFGFSLSLLTCFVLSFMTAKAGYVPVAVTGLNVDAVCNGTGTAAATTAGIPSGIDGGNYWFMDSTFNPGATNSFTYKAFPPSLNVNSAITPGLSWTLKSYSSNNALKIATP